MIAAWKEAGRALAHAIERTLAGVFGRRKRSETGKGPLVWRGNWYFDE